MGLNKDFTGRNTDHEGEFSLVLSLVKFSQLLFKYKCKKGPI